ncbi:magnesium chelatase [candidate division WWE3 bacterium CG_4_9_14_0_2_um_filter_35_11]|uniref:Magnesium chelatase n=1 Tax=candidate division WWE3 bacterium CG_4_9_14_0_2_um_filter_35_11 TaxID=1975077 RepID=A0A2M8EKW4_UNCKA|nr:MAG: magnesium chelatase [candidate division WWE3 bacterium CG10_big_fil_rev_8_21_14_0_10_35_32]PJC23384.1 MAG: magnesium chelatase [candidate division WWE3 bacterium CG_4_9_14_0_2_um_filter_35_11]
MSFSKVFTGAIVGLDAHLVEVEVNIDYHGFPGFVIVGLPAKEIDEAKERVRSAIKNCGYQFPNRKITVNLAPADIPKKGAFYDLPIAIGILVASGFITKDISKYFIIGELSLNGDVNKVAGVIPLSLFAKDNFEYIFLPHENSLEVEFVKGLKAKPVKSLSEVIDDINGDKNLDLIKVRSYLEYITELKSESKVEIDFKDIKGQGIAKRALEIAAAGGHNISLIGPPGTGKTLLSKALVSILPNLQEREAFEVTKIYSIAGQLKKEQPFISSRQFRAPHHSTSKAGLLGGGNPIVPGEISMAHRGVLFLDEFPELPREHIEALRQPIENHEIRISRASGAVIFPCNFMLIIASNPCPCGQYGNPQKQCNCGPYRVKKYQEKLSGPIIDRIDLHVACQMISVSEIESEFGQKGEENELEASLEIRKRVQKARDIQTKRYKGLENIYSNSDLNGPDIKQFCELGFAQKALMAKAVTNFRLSARAYYKILKVARTIADLAEAESISINHLAEALQYRFIEWKD